MTTGSDVALLEAVFTLRESSMRPGARTKSGISAANFLPPTRTLAAGRRAAMACRGCPLWQGATQTVFGEGSKQARLMLVGEMPGDQEDLAGAPFVGPAGRLLDEVLASAGIERANVYITNVVKHFKWEPRGKRRLHRKPTASEVVSCLPWFELEIEAVEPEVLVCLGATAARALLGTGVAESRGRFVPSALAPHVTATIHPSAVLRIPDRAARRRERDALAADLAFAKSALDGPRFAQ